MSEQLSERGKDLVKYMPQAVNALADRLIEKLGERLFYGEKQQTNADRIRAMSDEELAAFMFNANGCPMWVSDYSCKEDKGCHGAKGACWLDWLKQEATP